jgi:hypothetical protein
VRPMGDWSILMTLSRCSSPSMRSCSPGWVRAPFSWRASALYRISTIRVDLPEPETPVMHTILPSGMVTSMFFRLFSRAPTTTRCLPLPLRRFSGRGTLSARRDRRRSAIRGWPGSPPPCLRPPPRRRARRRPGPGPGSSPPSADGLFIVLHHQHRVAQVAQPIRVRSRRALSRGCRPMDGSSSTYSTPIRREPIWVARRMRWASPPESEPPSAAGSGNPGRHPPGSPAAAGSL